MTLSSPLVALGFIAAVLGVGTYVARALDAWTARRAAGIGGGRQPLVVPIADAARLLLVRRTTTERPDAPAWALAPALLAGVAAAAVATVPWDRGRAVADVNDGIVLFGAAMALVMVGVFLHGWAANSPMPLIGGYRFIALALSYEMPLALVLIAAALPARSLSMGAIVVSQHDVWNVIRQPLGLPLYLVTGMGLAFQGPLNVPDSADLAGGTGAEAAGPARLAWHLSQWFVLVAVVVVGAAVFLGGWWGPVLPGPAWMGLKVFGLLWLMAWINHRVARVRLERFVVVAWTVLIPLALVDVFVSGFLAL